MVTYEDARRFREQRDAPLYWAEDVPAPPRDRIAFTQLILETAAAVGLELPAWNEQFPYDDPDKRFEAFQQAIHQYTYRHTFRGIPRVHCSWWAGSVHSSGARAITCKEYVEALEKDYFEPWRTSWLFGAASKSPEIVELLLKEIILVGEERSLQECAHGWPVDRHILPDRTGEDIARNTVLAQFLTWYGGRALAREVQWATRVEVSLVHESWFGLRGDGPFIALSIIASCVVLATIMAVLRHVVPISPWWLVLILPVQGLISLWGVTFLPMVYIRWAWVREGQTFGELVDQIVAAKQREWEELQRRYRLPNAGH